MQQKECLKTLRMDEMCTSKHVMLFLNDVQQCTWLANTALDVATFGSREADQLLIIFSNMLTLKAFRIDGLQTNKFLSVKKVVDALASSRNPLESFELSNVMLDTTCMWTLAEGLGIIKNLQKILLDRCVTILTWPRYANMPCNIEPYIYLVKKLPQLKCLAFDLAVFTTVDQHAFWRALINCDTRVVLPNRVTDIPYLPIASSCSMTEYAQKVLISPIMNNDRFASFPSTPLAQFYGAVIVTMHGDEPDKVWYDYIMKLTELDCIYSLSIVQNEGELTAAPAIILS